MSDGGCERSSGRERRAPDTTLLSRSQIASTSTAHLHIHAEYSIGASQFFQCESIASIHRPGVGSLTDVRYYRGVPGMTSLLLIPYWGAVALKKVSCINCYCVYDYYCTLYSGAALRITTKIHPRLFICRPRLEAVRPRPWQPRTRFPTGV